jgi:hypothetical protein
MVTYHVTIHSVGKTHPSLMLQQLADVFTTALQEFKENSNVIKET